MGMNIYIEKNKCDCCNRSDLLHIGKASYGWEFTFKGYNYLEEEREKELSINSIMSYKDIKKAIKKCKIKNEYGDYITEKEFIDLVKYQKGGKEHNTYNDSHKDSEGYFFWTCEFC